MLFIESAVAERERKKKIFQSFRRDVQTDRKSQALKGCPRCQDLEWVGLRFKFRTDES